MKDAGKRRLKKVVVLMCTAIVFLQCLRSSASENESVEQIYINMPEVILYLAGEGADSVTKVTLGESTLQLMEDTVLKDCKEKNYYYVMLDISGSIPDARFKNIKESLISFMDCLNKKDRLVLISFGENVTKVLNGSEEKESAKKLIGGLENKDQKTALFDALEYVRTMIENAEAKKHRHRCIFIISDGKDCVDNTKSFSQEEGELKKLGIPVYTFAVENEDGDPQTDMEKYRKSFRELAENTGGISWTVDQGTPLLDALKQDADRILSLHRLKLEAPSNFVSNSMEKLTVRVKDKTISFRDVLVARSISDETAPAVKEIYLYDEKCLRVTFSEEVSNAEKIENYYLRRDGISIPIQQVVLSDELENAVFLIMGDKLKGGEYTLQINQIADTSKEQNGLKQTEWTFYIEGEETERKTETEKADYPAGTEALSETEALNGTDNVVKNKGAKTIPLIIPGIVSVVLIAVFGGLFIYSRRKKTAGSRKNDKTDPNATIAMSDEKTVYLGKAGLRNKQMMLYIIGPDGAKEDREVTVYHEAIIGRSEGDIVFQDRTMSKSHFKLIVKTDGTIELEDLGSTNGTLINGERIRKKCRLNSGDTVRAGSTEISFRW